MVVDEEESMEQALSQPIELFNSSAKISKRTSSIRNLEDTRTKSFVFLVALTGALGGLIVGYYIGGAGATFVMDGFWEHFGWSCAVGTYTDTDTVSSSYFIYVLSLTIIVHCICSTTTTKMSWTVYQKHNHKLMPMRV